MGITVAKPKTLQQQTKIWYKKLKKSGFDDIEQDEFYLKKWSNRFENLAASNDPEHWFKPKQDYYYYATQFANTYKFKSNKEKLIWEYHSNGISMREIAKLLKKVRIYISHETVRAILKPLIKLMKQDYIK
jgi:hypothetical protein